MSKSDKQSNDFVIINVLDQFEPFIFISKQNDVTTVSFDSNFKYDLQREAHVRYLDHDYMVKGGSISIKLGNIEFCGQKDGMKIVKADVDLNVCLKSTTDQIQDRITIHQMELAIPALSKNDDGSFNYLSDLDIKMTLSDKITDEASWAIENALSGKIENQSFNNEKINDLNPWAIGTSASSNKQPSIWSLLNAWPVWQKSLIGFVSIVVVVCCFVGIKSSFSTFGVDSRVTTEIHNPDALNAQVNLTRETLKSMGLDPTAVQSDLGCLAK